MFLFVQAFGDADVCLSCYAALLKMDHRNLPHRDAQEFSIELEQLEKKARPFGFLSAIFAASMTVVATFDFLRSIG
jgi:hypothetical protein